MPHHLRIPAHPPRSPAPGATNPAPTFPGIFIENARGQIRPFLTAPRRDYGPIFSTVAKLLEALEPNQSAGLLGTRAPGRRRSQLGGHGSGSVSVISGTRPAPPIDSPRCHCNIAPHSQMYSQWPLLPGSVKISPHCGHFNMVIRAYHGSLRFSAHLC